MRTVPPNNGPVSRTRRMKRESLRSRGRRCWPARSWARGLGGGFVGAALSVTLLALGMGLGFSAVSPWSNAGASATTIGIAAIVWMIVMHAISAAIGGYLAGRLRTKWVDVHSDEVFFRDTAHGFL